MKLAAEHWRSLSQLLDEALALPEPERAPWVAKLAEEHSSVKPLLADLFARPALVSTADLVGTLPSFALPEEAAVEAERSSGTIVGPYRLIRELGRGGMGAVWLAARTDGLVKREVALKLPILADPRATLAERFAREREILSPLAGRALTPDYAAPEQIGGAPLTTASDVYALGVVLYELLAGVRRYRLKRGTRAEIEEAILTQEVARPSARRPPRHSIGRSACSCGTNRHSHSPCACCVSTRSPGSPTRTLRWPARCRPRPGKSNREAPGL
jgi:serine/threonine protein kinase